MAGLKKKAVFLRMLVVEEVEEEEGGRRPPRRPQNYRRGHRVGWRCQMLYPDRTFLIGTDPGGNQR